MRPSEHLVSPEGEVCPTTVVHEAAAAARRVECFEAMNEIDCNSRGRTAKLSEEGRKEGRRERRKEAILRRDKRPMEFDRDIRTEISHSLRSTAKPKLPKSERAVRGRRGMHGTTRRRADGRTDGRRGRRRHTKSCGNDVEIKTAKMVVPFSQVPGQKCQI